MRRALRWTGNNLAQLTDPEISALYSYLHDLPATTH